jgi:hypothetical protein
MDRDGVITITAKERWGFEPQGECTNCEGSGYFACDNYDGEGAEAEPCTFCMEEWEDANLI